MQAARGGLTSLCFKGGEVFGNGFQRDLGKICIDQRGVVVAERQAGVLCVHVRRRRRTVGLGRTSHLKCVASAEGDAIVSTSHVYAASFHDHRSAGRVGSAGTTKTTCVQARAKNE